MIMIHNRASRMATRLVNNKIIDGSSHDVYTYGFELMLSGLANVVLIVMVSFAFHRYYDWVLFLSAFIPLRTTAGGYHASTHFRCIITGTTIFAILLLTCQLRIDWTRVILTVSTISFILVLSFSPVEVSNKKLTDMQRKKNRQISIYISSCNMLIAVATFFVEGFSGVLIIYFAGVFAAALSMLVVKKQKKK